MCSNIFAAEHWNERDGAVSATETKYMLVQNRVQQLTFLRTKKRKYIQFIFSSQFGPVLLGLIRKGDCERLVRQGCFLIKKITGRNKHLLT